MKKKVGEIPPFGDPGENPSQEWPYCKKCGYLPVKAAKEYDENGRGTRVPIDHGLCHPCRKNELNAKRALQAKAEVDQAIEEFEQTPIDPEVERYWDEITPKIEELFDGPLIGKVGEEALEKIRGLKRGLYEIFDGVIEESECPGYG